jgi:hypothetical protein
MPTNTSRRLQRARLQAAPVEQVFTQCGKKMSQPLQQGLFDGTYRENCLWIPVTQKSLDRPAEFPSFIVLDCLCVQTENDLLAAHPIERLAGQ